MQVVILAGGMGTRLRSVVSDRPKPMALINDKPFLEYLIRYLKNNGFKDIILSVGYKANMIQDYFQDGKWLGVNIKYSLEEEPLGTGGAIKLAQKMIHTDNFMVVNGDTFLKIPFNKFIKQHDNLSAIVSMALYYHNDTGRYGTVLMNEYNKIVSFVEKGDNTGPGLINGGVYLLNKDKISVYFNEDSFSLEKDIFPLLIEQAFVGMPFDSYFIDIGIPEDYERAKTELMEAL